MSLLLISCDDDEIEAGTSSVYPIAGEWVVNEYLLDGTNVYGPYILDIYNTSFSEDSLWVDNIYDSGVKVKAAKTGETTFAVSGAADINEVFATVDIREAKVIDNDSIYFVVVLYDETGAIIDEYAEAGHRRTGFEE
jgi:hypothetical protein